MINVSMRHLNVQLIELHKGQEVLQSFNKTVHLWKNYIPWPTPTDTQERFYFYGNSWNNFW